MNKELGDIWPLVLVNRETRQGSRTMDQIKRRADRLLYVAWMDVRTRHQPWCSILLYYTSSITNNKYKYSAILTRCLICFDLQYVQNKCTILNVHNYVGVHKSSGYMPTEHISAGTLVWNLPT